MKFGRNVLQLQVNMASYVQDGGHDVILRRKVLPPGECTRRVCPAHMQPASASSRSAVHSHLLGLILVDLIFFSVK